MKKIIAIIVITLVVYVGSLLAVCKADPIGGTRQDNDVLRPGQTVTYTIPCYEDEPTAFAIAGDGDGDIDCELYDSLGNLLRRDTRPVDGCQFTITPAWNGSFRFVATNVGYVSSAYYFRAY
jgi:hypothetical protein